MAKIITVTVLGLDGEAQTSNSKDLNSDQIRDVYADAAAVGGAATIIKYEVRSGKRVRYHVSETVAAVRAASNQLESESTPQILTGAGAVNLTSKITHLVTTGANALTLANGYEGQEKIIAMKTDGGAGTLTPTSMAGGTTITFDDVDDIAFLQFINGKWHVVKATATVA